MIGKRFSNGRIDFKDMLERGMKGVVYLYFISMLVIYPFYYQNKYFDMGSAKYNFYQKATITFLITMLLLLVFHIIVNLGKSGIRLLEKEIHLTLTDWCVLAYGVVVLISYGLSDYKSMALWGYNGWNMGLIMQLSLVALYYFISRWWSCNNRIYDKLLMAACAVAAVTYLLAILNRFQIDPLRMYEGVSEDSYILFLSTLGQATWYSSYLVITFPIGLFAFWYYKKTSYRIAGGIFTALGFATMVTQNSDSAFMGFAAIIFVFFWFSLESNERFRHFLEMLLIGLVAFRIIGICQVLFPDKVIKLDSLSIFASQHAFMWIPLCLVLALYLIVLKLEREGKWDVAKFKGAREVLLICILAGVFAIIVCIVLITKEILPESLRKIDYLYFDNTWGNNRGSIWRTALRVFKGYPVLMKLFGCGPDAFAAHAYRYYGGQIFANWGNMTVANAHNEWLNMLVVSGVTGFAAYVGIFITSVKKYMAKVSEVPLLMALVASICAYMIHNLFCYQQVICTPIIFILIGIGENMRKSKNNGAIS